VTVEICEMSKMENAKIKTMTSILLVCLAIAIVSPVQASYTVGMNKGDWIKYRLKAWSSAAGYNTTYVNDWIKLTIANVSGTNVMLTVESNQTGWTSPQNYTEDVASDCTLDVIPVTILVALTFLPIVPAKLNASSAIPEGYMSTTISNVTQYHDQYGDHDSAHYGVHSAGYAYDSYWDRQHGVLLATKVTESYLSIVAYGNSLTIEDTNIWSLPMNWLLYVLIAIIVVVVVAVAVYVFVLRKKKPPTTPPTQQAPSPPPPPPPT
jgi:hypothetical protein